MFRTSQLTTAVINNSPNHHNSVQAAIQKLNNLNVQNCANPSMQQSRVACIRPGYGTRGEQHLVRTNYFPITISPNRQVVHLYKVVMQPDQKDHGRRREIIELAQAEPNVSPLVGRLAFDHPAEHVITTTEVRFMSVNVYLGSTSFVVRFDYLKAVDISTLQRYANCELPAQNLEELTTCTMALNVIFAKLPRQNQDTILAIGKDKYFPLDQQFMKRDLGNGVEAIRGFFSSVRFQALGVALNLNVCTSAFYRNRNLGDWLAALNRNDGRRETFIRFFTGTWVESDFLQPGQMVSYRIAGMDFSPPSSSQSHVSGQTVQQFFQSRKKPPLGQARARRADGEQIPVGLSDSQIRPA